MTLFLTQQIIVVNASLRRWQIFFFFFFLNFLEERLLAVLFHISKIWRRWLFCSLGQAIALSEVCEKEVPRRKVWESLSRWRTFFKYKLKCTFGCVLSKQSKLLSNTFPCNILCKSHELRHLDYIYIYIYIYF